MGFWDDAGTVLGYGLGGPIGGMIGGGLGGGGNPLSGAQDLWKWGSSRPDITKGNDDKAYTQGFLNQGSPYVGASPYQGGFNSLINQLTQQANGQGPSLAGNAYNQASNQAMAQQSALSQGGASAGAGRQAAMNMANIGQGQAAGYANARGQEQVASQSALSQALAAGNNADFQRQQQNSNAWQDILAQQLGITKAQLQAMMGQQSNFQTLGGLVQGAGAAAGVAGK